MTDPNVSVLVLTKNPGQQFKMVMDALVKQRGIIFEILVVDSGSTDGTLEVLEDYNVRLYKISPEEFGHGRTRNWVAARAKGSLLAFITHDSQPANVNWLTNLTTPFSDESVAGVFGRQIPKPGSDLLEKYYLDYLYPETGREMSMSRNDKYKLPKFFFSNANSMIRKSVWREFKFPEGVIMSEDQWWAKKVLSNNYKIIYQPKSVVKHSHSYNLKNLFKRNFDSGSSVKGLNQSSILESFLGLVKYSLGEIYFLIKNGQWGLVPYALIRETIRALGFAAGQNYHIFPSSIRKVFSIHKYYWRSTGIRS